MSKTLELALCQAWPVDRWRDLHVLVAVSGGADSVALLCALAALKQQAGGKGRLFVAHFNHQLRGAQSDADAEWVAQLTKELGIEATIGCPAGDLASDLNSEQRARDARYAFLVETAEQLGARFVATGHTAGDQTETILHRIFRGASIQGLAGIPFTRPLCRAVDVVRPLLQVTREQIIESLTQLGQDYRTDATNAQSQFTRNRLRLSVLPALREEFGPNVDRSLRRLGSQAAEAYEVIESLALALLQQAIQPEGPSAGPFDGAFAETAGGLRIDCKQLTGHPPLIVREACKLAWRSAGWPEQSMGSAEWGKLYAFLLSTSPETVITLPGGVEVRRKEGVALLRRLSG